LAGEGGVVGKQVVEDLGIAVTTVDKQGNHARNELIEGSFVGEECGRQMPNPVFVDANQLPLADQVTDVGGLYPQPVGELREGEK
jgi:hypothetical protein